MIDNRKHNLMIDALINEIVRLELVPMDKKISKEFKEVIEDVVEYIANKHYKD